MTTEVRWTVTPDGMVSMQTLAPVEIEALFNAVAGIRLMIKEGKPWSIPPEPKILPSCRWPEIDKWPNPTSEPAECSS